MERNDFKKLVFLRDKNLCVVCSKPAVDAHHIIDRSLFNDGGYYIDNGVSLCSECHIKAETTEISCEELRKKANIRNTIYPNNFVLNEFVKDYDKWGNPILKNGKRLKGYIFENSNVQKILKQGNVLELFQKEEKSMPDKYGRTYHLPFSPGTTSDDRISKNFNNFLKGEIIISEKLDGENNCLISEYGVFTRSRVEPTKNPWSIKMWELFHTIKNDIKGLEIYGESLYAEHSIIYSRLKEYFYIFGIKEIETNTWLSWDETEEFAFMLSLPTVPVLFKSNKDFNISEKDFEKMILEMMTKPSLLSNNKFWETEKEGVVVRLANRFPNDMFFNSILKYVRKNHVKTDEHWSKNWKRAKLEFEL